MRKRTPHRNNPETEVEEKYCSKCETWKPLEEYCKKTASWDGLETKCRSCTTVKMRTYRSDNPQYDKGYYDRNKEYINESKRKYYYKNRADILKKEKAKRDKKRDENKAKKAKDFDLDEFLDKQRAKREKDAARQRVKAAMNKD